MDYLLRPEPSYGRVDGRVDTENLKFSAERRTRANRVPATIQEILQSIDSELFWKKVENGMSVDIENYRIAQAMSKKIDSVLMRS
jgi:hypothetical protein